jgi:LPS O-antigen subunit length determinant protein (WzzB/FepE family)
MTRTVTHTVVTGGTPGWLITLIAVGAAVLAAVIAVLIHRAWTARRHVTASAT